MQTHFPNPESKPEIRSVQTGFWSSNSKRPPLDLIASPGPQSVLFLPQPRRNPKCALNEGKPTLEKNEKGNPNAYVHAYKTIPSVTVTEPTL